MFNYYYSVSNGVTLTLLKPLFWPLSHVFPFNWLINKIYSYFIHYEYEKKKKKCTREYEHMKKLPYILIQLILGTRHSQMHNLKLYYPTSDINIIITRCDFNCEDLNHMLFECPFVNQVWTSYGICMMSKMQPYVQIPSSILFSIYSIIWLWTFNNVLLQSVWVCGSIITSKFGRM